MGGGYYERDVGVADEAKANVAADDADAGNQQGFSRLADQILSRNRSMHPDLDPLNRTVECETGSAIVCAIDVTGSMGNWSKIVWDKLPMFFGQIMLQGYLEDLSISFAAIGDSNTDAAPLQVTKFAQGIEIDDQISKMYLEGNGGGQNYESYELAAYYYSRKVNFTGLATKPFFFITGDEMYYPGVLREHVRQFIGDDIPESIPAPQIWAELCEKYHVFLLHKPNVDRVVNRRLCLLWEAALGKQRVLHLTEPKAIVDTMLGAIALTTGARTLAQFEDELRDRGQSEQRCKDVRFALGPLSRHLEQAAQPGQEQVQDQYPQTVPLDDLTTFRYVSSGGFPKQYELVLDATESTFTFNLKEESFEGCGDAQYRVDSTHTKRGRYERQGDTIYLHADTQTCIYNSYNSMDRGPEIQEEDIVAQLFFQDNDVAITFHSGPYYTVCGGGDDCTQIGGSELTLVKQ